MRPRVYIMVFSLVSALFVLPQPAFADPPVCGVSAGHTICVAVLSSTLTGSQQITVTNNPNNGIVIFTWLPSLGPSTKLMTDFKKSPGTGTYSFTWPTHKYLDDSGTLRAQANTTSSVPIDVSVTLSNGNLTDIQHSPNDWSPPSPWAGSGDPVVTAVGDGASDEKTGDDLAAAINASNPAMFLYLGDVYETGTITEFPNHYGASALDGVGTLWGTMASFTQPTLGNHESIVAWQDYWHQRPTYTSFTFGGVLFFTLDSSLSFSGGSPQYNYVEGVLTGTTPPACVVATWHVPMLKGDKVVNGQKPMWALLFSHGGDLVLSASTHNLTEYVPLDGSVQTGTGAHMVQIVAGSGGHKLGVASTGTNVAFSRGKTAAAVYLTLNGAGGGGTATAISWTYKQTNGTVLGTGGVTC